MERLGQVPIVVNREIEGFVLNRLQGALLNEAWALYDAGIASVADIDSTVAHGLGLRWSFMGPFETIDLNAPGGVADYAQRLGPLYHSIALSRTAPEPWSPPLIERSSRNGAPGSRPGNCGSERHGAIVGSWRSSRTGAGNRMTDAWCRDRA